MRIEGERDAAGVLARVIEAVLAGDVAEAAAVATTLERPYWRDVKAQHVDFVKQLARERKTTRLNGDGRKRSDPDKLRRRVIYRRDRYLCRFSHCGRRTVDEWVFAALGRILPTELTYHPNWPLEIAHPVIWTYAATLEHVLPWSLGGDNGDDNLITACAGCNYSKGNYTIEVLDWSVNPEAPATETWNGLSEFAEPLNDLADRLGAPPTPLWGGAGPRPRAGLSGEVPISFEAIEVDNVIKLALPGRTQRRSHRVLSKDADGVQIIEMWTSKGVWVVGRTVRRLGVGELSAATLVSESAPNHGDPTT